MSDKDIREKIRTRRKELGLSLEEVAKKVGVTKATVHRWETGVISNMGIDKANLLADILKLNPLELLGRDNQKNDPISQLTKKEKLNYEEFMEQSKFFFNDENVSEEDKELFFKSLQEIFLDSLKRTKKWGIHEKKY